MSKADFIDYYEILQLSPGADQEAIDSMFRHLAQRYHPDNRASGDTDKFRLVVEAHNALKNPANRAGYDVRHAEFVADIGVLHQELTGDSSIGTDIKLQNAIVHMLYHRCRDHFSSPGMGLFRISQTLGCRPEQLEFHVWYLKEKGYIRRLDDGSIGITAAGVDRAIDEERRTEQRRRITDQSERPDKVIRL